VKEHHVIDGFDSVSIKGHPRFAADAPRSAEFGVYEHRTFEVN
jgi:hypothetical protein